MPLYHPESLKPKNADLAKMKNLIERNDMLGRIIYKQLSTKERRQEKSKLIIKCYVL
jgi:hypothetical protein